MKRESRHDEGGLSDFLLIPPAAALVGLGMVLPEYWLILVVSAFFGMTVLAIVQKINRGDNPRLPEEP